MDRGGRILSGAGIALVAAFALWSYREWPGQWPWTVDAVNGSTVLTGPLTAALAAAVQLTASRLAPVADASPRGWLVPVRSAGIAAATGLAVLTATAVVAAAVTAAGPHGGPLEWWSLSVGVLTLGMCALAGSLAAYWIPQRVVVPAVGVVLFLLGAFGPVLLRDLLRHGPSTGSLAGLVWDPDVLVGRLLGLVAVSACLVVAMLPWRQARGRGLRVVLAVAVGAALVGALACLDRAGSYRWTASDETPSRCAGSAPAVCLSASSVRRLSVTHEAVRRPAALLARAGVELPPVFDEELPYRPGDPEHGTLQPVTVERPSLREGAALLTRPSPCPQWSDPAGPPAPVVFEAEQVLVEWMVARGGGRPVAHSPAMKDWLATIGSESATAWVVRTYRSLRTCSFEAVTLPWAP